MLAFAFAHIIKANPFFLYLLLLVSLILSLCLILRYQYQLSKLYYYRQLLLVVDRFALDMAPVPFKLVLLTEKTLQWTVASVRDTHAVCIPVLQYMLVDTLKASTYVEEGVKYIIMKISASAGDISFYFNLLVLQFQSYRLSLFLMGKEDKKILDINQGNNDYMKLVSEKQGLFKNKVNLKENGLYPRIFIRFPIYRVSWLK